MTRELIIEGQHVDLAPDTDITLEYVSNILSDPGKISLSHSYTVKLPKTARNARILDDPGRPGYDSSLARRFLTAQYFRNGIDLIGQAQAYLVSISADSYEVVLVWSRVPGLKEWNDAKLKLPDLTGLPTLQWKGAAYATAGTTDGCFFARYVSGAWNNAPNIAPHPSVTLYELMTRIFKNAGVPYEIGDRLTDTLQSHALLVAPSHKPSLTMELDAGAQASSLKWITTSGSGSYWWFQGWQTGWDAPGDGSLETTRTIQRGPSEELRFYLNLKIAGATPDLYFSLEHGGDSYILSPSRTTDGGYLMDTVVDLNSDLRMDEEYDYFSIKIMGLSDNGTYSFSAYDPLRPMFALIRPHETIQAEHQNLFPISDNLPNIGQMDFIKAVLGLFGALMWTANGTLVLERYDDILHKEQAVDWTHKVDMREGIQDFQYLLSDFAQKNLIKYEPDVTLPVSPDITLEMEDPTADESKELLKLPFAASIRDQAIHYRCTDAWDDNGQYYVEVEDIDIKPRIFGFTYDGQTRGLRFPDSLSGKWATSAYLETYQSLIRTPVQISVNIRLHELDLAQLDTTRPVYLGQYGRYYAILKIQTSKTDLCKVELLQLP
jgi:hypothetical protein